jgi:hypothetical protein
LSASTPAPGRHVDHAAGAGPLEAAGDRIGRVGGQRSNVCGWRRRGFIREGGVTIVSGSTQVAAANERTTAGPRRPGEQNVVQGGEPTDAAFQAHFVQSDEERGARSLEASDSDVGYGAWSNKIV